MLPIPWLDADPHAPFPAVDTALRDPNGLLAAGGDLSVPRLVTAYANGIFPWFSPGEPILWWSPDPRMVFHTDSVHLSSRFRRQLRRSGWIVRADTAFDRVIAACADSPRAGQRGTWISSAMRDAYCELHRQGHAHSLDVFDGKTLVGGIYGVAVGRMFFGESMFSGVSGGSKLALAALAMFLRQHGCPLIDAQVENPHLVSLGASTMPRAEFSRRIARLRDQDPLPADWSAAFGEHPASSLAGGPDSDEPAAV